MYSTAPELIESAPAVIDIDDVLRQHGPMLSRIAASYEFESGRREDLLQEISLALWRALPQWRSEASLRTFVARVAHNRAVDHLGKYCRLNEHAIDESHPDPVADPQHHAEAQQRRDALLAAVRRLALGQRPDVVWALQGFSHLELWQALVPEENAVAQPLNRARKQLADWLGGNS